MYSTSTPIRKQNSKRQPAQLASTHALKSDQEMRRFIRICESAQSNGEKMSLPDRNLYNQYWRILASPFTASELIEMHALCRNFRDELHAGGTPSIADQDRFMAFSKVVYEKEVPGGF